MREIVAYEWMTLDGVFDADSMEVWFNPFHSEERAAHIRETITGSGALLLGRVTYDMLAPYWSSQETDEMGPASKLNAMPKYVVSSTKDEAQWQNTRRIIKEDVAEQIRELKQEPGGDILITGSATLVKLLMQAGLVDEFRFLVHPIVVGRGARFFREGMESALLHLAGSETLDLGVLALVFQPATTGRGYARQ